MKVGDRVYWESQSGGNWTRKVGDIVAVVPANVPPRRIIDRCNHSVQAAKPMFDGMARGVDSYLVLVRSESKPKVRIYFPRVSGLKLVANESGWLLKGGSDG